MRRRRHRDTIDRHDVQVNVLDGVGHPCAHHLVARIDDPDGARRLLAELADTVDHAGHWGARKPSILLNVGVSAAGLGALGVEPAVVNSFGEAFAAGMASRAAVLGDHGPSRPSRWVPGFESREAHLLVWIHGETPEVADAHSDRYREAFMRSGLALVHEVRAATADDAREHFGFADGYAQPEIAGVPRVPGEEGQLTWRGERPLPAGEFLFGYRDALGVIAPVGRTPLGRNGTILVWRQLHQDVAGFRAAVAAAGRAIGIDADAMAAKLVGRWQDGTPLVVSPLAPAGGGAELDDFRYEMDPVGARCPIGAHVRRANPRDSLVQRSMTTRHRIIRRGMPYGPRLVAGRPDDGAERGLLFACFNASPERQFEFIQQQWCNDGTRLGRGSDRDPVIGAPFGTGRFLVEGFPPRVVTGLPTFVTTRAGEYFLVPGLGGLRHLSAV